MVHLLRALRTNICISRAREGRSDRIISFFAHYDYFFEHLKWIFGLEEITTFLLNTFHPIFTANLLVQKTYISERV